MTAYEDRVLRWCQRSTSQYENVNIVDFTDSWKNGLALNALINSLRPEVFLFEDLEADNVYENIMNAVDTAEQLFHITANPEIEMMAASDHDTIFNFVREIYEFCGGDAEENGDETGDEKKYDEEDLGENADEAESDDEDVEEQLNVSDDEQDRDEVDLDVTLLMWCQRKVSRQRGVVIQNFDNSWTDGVALNALVNVLCPGLIDFHHLDIDDVYMNIANALDIAQTIFNTQTEVSVEDFVSGNTDNIFGFVLDIYLYLDERNQLQDNLYGDLEDHDDVASDREDEVAEFDCSVCLETLATQQGLPCRTSGVQPDGNNQEDNKHRVCLDCLKEQAAALCTGGRLAPFGTGLLCVEAGCNNIYPWGVVRPHLDAEVQRVLERRIDNEALMFLNDQLENCKSCAFVMEFVESMDDDPVFHCISCAASFCRRCKIDWNVHNGRTCAEMDKGRDTARVEVEEDLSKVKIRECHRCHVRFAKEDGCNSMTCRCGATQCYCCRAPDIEYRHFCSHAIVNGQCSEKCGRKCVLFADEKTVDGEALLDVRQKAERDDRKREHIAKLA